MSADEEDFCCSGCAHVYNLIQDSGLTRFYDLRGREIEPVSPAANRPGDYGWLETLAAEAGEQARATGKAARISLDIKGISCVGCVWLIDELFRRRKGAIRLDIRPQTGVFLAEWKPDEFDLVDFAKDLRRFGYRLAPPASETARGDSGPLLTRLGVCAFLALNTMLFTLPGYLGMEDDFPFAGVFELLTLLFSTLSYGVGGLWFVGRAWDAARMGILHIDLPIAIGVTAAWFASVVGWLLGYEPLIYFDFVAIFIFLMLTGRWVQERSVERNRARVRTLDPSAAVYESAEGKEPVQVSSIAPGKRFVVPPGGTVPVLCLLESDSASVSLESINGEPEPISLSRGGRIPSGAILNSATPVILEALEEWRESLLHRLVSENASTSRNPILEKVLTVYTGLIIGISVLGGTTWTVFSGILPGIQVAVSVLVVSCPCSLGIAWPLINDLSAALLRRKGLYLRNIEVWGRLTRVDTIVFDKTGTLTLEIPKLANPEELSNLSNTEKQALFALVESSFHPFGRALRERLLRERVASAILTDFKEVPGKGVSGNWNGHNWSLGKSGWLDADSDSPQGTIFARGGERIACFFFEDEIREGATAEIAQLNRSGFSVAVLSGDRRDKVHTLASSLHIDPAKALGELDPLEKANWIEQHAPNSALMIGDGANDALAFNRATCRGTPLLDKGILESRCDFFFTGRDLSALRNLFAVASVRSRRLRSVFAFAVAYNTAAIAVCLAGWMNPLLAAILMPASALITLAIASRIRIRR